jgi:hypothetical protein
MKQLWILNGLRNYSNKVILRQNTNSNKWIRYAVAKEQNAGGDITYKIDQIEEPKLKSYTNIKEQLQHMFFPKGYPHSVTNNYHAFFKWNLVTAISGSVTNSNFSFSVSFTLIV